MSTTSVHRVTGMTCDHCVRAVEQEVGTIAGVTAVHVDLATGEVRVSSSHEIPRAELAAAVDEAGYELAS
ncbi:MAG TPA: copper ion binding protein [Nocardioides sp.]|jgi:copper chaperone|nr:copper ion binding protein [Nocardioides sp.]